MRRPPLGGRVVVAALFVSMLVLAPRAQVGESAMREPAWAPDGRRLAIVSLDRIWTMLPDGREAKELTRVPGAEREPAWSADGRRIAFAADRGNGVHLYVVNARGGEAERLTDLPGDERSPSWTPDGRLVFSYRRPGDRDWDLFMVDTADAPSVRAPVAITQSADDDIHPRVSPDGRYVAFASNRDNEDGDFDIWILRLLDRRTLPRERAARSAAMSRLVRARGDDAYPAWAPEGDRLAFYAVRDGVGSTWVVPVVSPPGGGNPAVAEHPESPAMLVSRHGGSIAWSPDGRTLTIADVPDPQTGYNGNPRRDPSDPPPLFATGRAFQLWTVPAPRPVDAGGRVLTPGLPLSPLAMTQAFDGVWSTLQRLYYRGGEASAAWDRLGAQFRARAARARSFTALESIVDDLIAVQPLVKPAVSSGKGVVVSAHPLASDVGRAVLARGGNVIDAAVAVAFALGVVEPDASGIGGDGQAIVFLKGMSEPVVVEYKDQTPQAATLDNARIISNGRIVGDGPAAANIPGVVAGLDYLHARYGSGRISWSDLIAPAVGFAEDGFVLDETLPSTIAEGRQLLEKYPSAARVFLPGLRVPAAGERFVNRDYADTLRVLAREGADAFYRGSIARRIAADMSANGGLITYEDLAQYRAIERKPVSARYRGHVLYTGGPPVAAGVSLLEAFQVLGNYTPRAPGIVTRNADYWHHAIESWKVRDRIARIGDPDRWAVEYEHHLDPTHAAELYRRVRRDRAVPFPDDSGEASSVAERIGSGTTAIVIADGDGNMIAMTNTLSTWGGSFYVSRGLGFLYNNHLRSFRTAAGAYGQLLPLTRSNTTNVPLFVFREVEGRPQPFMAVGAAGNAWIPASMYSVVTSVIDGGLSMQEAVEAPRFMVTRDPADPFASRARVEIEDRFPGAILRELEARGHTFHKIGRKGEMRYGYVSSVLLDTARQRIEGGADPRRSHAAVAVDAATRFTQ